MSNNFHGCHQGVLELCLNRFHGHKLSVCLRSTLQTSCHEKFWEVLHGLSWLCQRAYLVFTYKWDFDHNNDTVSERADTFYIVRFYTVCIIALSCLNLESYCKNQREHSV